MSEEGIIINEDVDQFENENEMEMDLTEEDLVDDNDESGIERYSIYAQVTTSNGTVIKHEAFRCTDPYLEFTAGARIFSYKNSQGKTAMLCGGDLIFSVVPE